MMSLFSKGCWVSFSQRACASPENLLAWISSPSGSISRFTLPSAFNRTLRANLKIGFGISKMFLGTRLSNFLGPDRGYHILQAHGGRGLEIPLMAHVFVMRKRLKMSVMGSIIPAGFQLIVGC